MMVAATIRYDLHLSCGIPCSHTEEHVFTSADFASLDDLLNHLRHKYLQKIDEVSIQLLIELDGLEYSLKLESKILKQRVDPFRVISLGEHNYLYFLFNLVQITASLDEWLQLQRWNSDSEDDLIKDFEVNNHVRES
jgi:hypothetical protein